MSLRKGIGQRLHSIRIERGMSQEDVAFQGKMSVRTYGKIERGEVNYEIETLEKIMGGLGISARDLLEGLKE